MAGIRCLQKNGVPIHVLSVLSNDSLADPDGMLDFYIGENIDKVCFNVEESEGTYVSELFTRPVPSCARASPPSCAASGTRRGRAAA